MNDSTEKLGYSVVVLVAFISLLAASVITNITDKQYKEEAECEKRPTMVWNEKERICEQRRMK